MVFVLAKTASEAPSFLGLIEGSQANTLDELVVHKFGQIFFFISENTWQDMIGLCFLIGQFLMVPKVLREHERRLHWETWNFKQRLAALRRL